MDSNFLSTYSRSYLDNGMTTTRGSNVSVLHLRSTSEPWETTPSPAYQQTSTPSARSYLINRSSNIPPLTKHQSLGSTNTRDYKWQNSPSFHSGGEVNSPDMFVGAGNCNRELSPVRWCDREVDGVYLNKSGWVQVQQRSLDESKRFSYTGKQSSLQAKRSQVKLSDYHFNSEPSSAYVSDRPAYLSLQSRDYDRKAASPSPPHESFSSPSVTPIISPPPAFQDKNRSFSKTRTFFGKTPFLPRSDAIVDSDASPPPSPQWKSSVQSSQIRKPKVTTPSPITEKPLRNVARMPQTKSLEDTTANRRSQFSQHYKGSSSSSSSSMGFRSLDSNFNRPGIIMPRLSENTDSSVDQYQDADEEDNNSSSINMSMMPILSLGVKNNAQPREKDKISPSGRSSSRSIHHRSQLRRSPAGSDSNKNHSSSSSSSNEFLSKSPPRPSPAQQQVRRSAPSRGYQPSRSQEMEEAAVQRVRRSRSLQLPEKKPPPHGREPPPPPPRAAPQQLRASPDALRAAKMGSAAAKRLAQGKPPSSETEGLDEDMMREAEVVAGFLYGNRSRAAAQALLMHRYNNNSISKEEKNKEINKPINNGLTVYYVGNPKKDPQKVLVRGATSPSLPSSKQSFERQDIKNPCTSDTCDFWPHCAHSVYIELLEDYNANSDTESNIVTIRIKLTLYKLVNQIPWRTNPIRLFLQRQSYPNNFISLDYC
ncbi:unnamed protein product [Phaedon cochleariae]|uniref:Uncharacterized protein n=1 Tax=Phaedon cochleariae TaxID=80249 RepID=A0A9P0DU50_PHACE|nr:unnamed protein product [Phaedon cochleariae]